MGDYAIVEHGGKQYRVSPGDVLLVERVAANLKPGDPMLFDRVVLVSTGDSVRVGSPVVEGAAVRSSVIAAERGPKLIIFKKKLRKGYRRTNGHRQNYYRVRVEAIEA
jgi:large subunit ribosomal protein L21